MKLTPTQMLARLAVLEFVFSICGLVALVKGWPVITGVLWLLAAGLWTVSMSIATRPR